MESLKSLCCCCAQKIKRSKPCTQEISEKVFDLTGCSLNDIRNLLEICSKCVKRLNDVELFRQEIIEAQKSLRTTLGLNQENTIKVEHYQEPLIVETFSLKEEELLIPNQYLVKAESLDFDDKSTRKESKTVQKNKAKKKPKVVKKAPVKEVKTTPKKRRVKTEAEYVNENVDTLEIISRQF
jgi:hypothetical protein